jgi:predicted metal-dependent hydrolase
MLRGSRSPLTILGTREIDLDGRCVTYTLKRSSRARYIRLEVQRGTGLTVVVPKRHSVEEVTGFIRAKRGWVLRKLAEYARAPQLEAGARNIGDTVCYLGSDLRLVRAPAPGRRSSVRLERTKLVISSGSVEEGLGALLERWYRARAGDLIARRAAELGARMGVSYKRLAIRGQRTRWGSCSHKGTLSFNWKLMMAPPAVIDYVIIHELAHLREMNHSRRFWELVAEHCPQWREHRKWLKEHESHLAAGFSA